jgi:hypothetical protein
VRTSLSHDIECSVHQVEACRYTHSGDLGVFDDIVHAGVKESGIR